MRDSHQSSRDPGLFIVLEGIDGSGSTTQGDRLTNWLRRQGHRAYFTHEPSSGPAGMLIRLALSRRLLGPNSESHDHSDGSTLHQAPFDPHSLALLYAADRMDHLGTELLPNLDRGRIVVCDRYVMSTLAYQGLTVDEEWLVDINRFAPRPDLTIYLDVPVEHARDRMHRTRWTKELYEDKDKLRLIRDRYQSLLRSRTDLLGPCLTVDASLSKMKVANIIRDAVSQLIQTQPSNHPTPELTLFH